MRARPVPLLVLATSLATLLAGGGSAEEARLDDAQMGQVAVENEALDMLAEGRERDCFGRGDQTGGITDCYAANLPGLADRDPVAGYRAILEAIDELSPDDH